MIKDNQKYFNRLQVVLDALVIAFSYWLSWVAKFMLPFLEKVERGAALCDLYAAADSYRTVLFDFILWLRPVYAEAGAGTPIEFANIAKANLLGFLSITLVLYMIKEMHISRTMLGIFLVINSLLELLERNAIRYVLRKMRKKGYNQKHILLVGYSRAAEEYINRIIENPQWGYTVRGILDDHVEAGTIYRGIKVVGRIANLPVILPENKLDEIAITLGLNEYFRLEEIAALCEKSGVHTKFIPDYHNIIPTKPYTEDLLGLPVVNIRYVPLSNTFNAMVKRLMDVVGSLCCIILFSPIMLAACLGIKLTSPGPLIYRQVRVGLHNRSFEMYKFRSMEVQPETEETKAWTVKTIQGLPELENSCGRPALTNYRSCLMC